MVSSSTIVVTEELLESFGHFKEIGEEKRLIRNLLQNYEKLSRPRLTVNQTVAVLLDLIIIRFTELVS